MHVWWEQTLKKVPKILISSFFSTAMRCLPLRFDSLMTVYIRIEWFVFWCHREWLNEFQIVMQGLNPTRIETHKSGEGDTPENSNWESESPFSIINAFHCQTLINMKWEKSCGVVPKLKRWSIERRNMFHRRVISIIFSSWGLFLIRTEISFFEGTQRTQNEHFPAKCSVARDGTLGGHQVKTNVEKNALKLQWNLIEIHELPLGNQRAKAGKMLFIMLFHPRKSMKLQWNRLCWRLWDELKAKWNVDAIRLGIIVRLNRLNRINSWCSSTVSSWRKS